MADQTGVSKAAGMVPDELKFEPKSKGLATPRKKKPKELAVRSTPSSASVARNASAKAPTAASLMVVRGTRSLWSKPRKSKRKWE